MELLRYRNANWILQRLTENSTHNTKSQVSWTRYRHYFSLSSDWQKAEDSNTKCEPSNGDMLTRFTEENFRARWGNSDKKDQTPMNSARNRAKMEAEMRRKGLSTELDDTNKGFAMLQKMGYKKGAKKLLISTARNWEHRTLF